MSKRLLLTCLVISLSGCGDSVEKWDCGGLGLTIDISNKTLLFEADGQPYGAITFEINGDKLLLNDPKVDFGQSYVDRKTGELWEKGVIFRRCEKI